MTNVSAYLAESAGRHPDARAVVCEHTTTSYSELSKDVARFAEYLTDSGVKPGDRAGVMLPNRLEFTAVFYGVLRAGGVVVPLSPTLHARAAEFILSITGTKLLFATPRHMIASTVAAVTAGTQPVEVGNHGIAHLTSGFPGRAEPVSRAAGDAAIVLPVADTTRVRTITHGELVRSQAVTADLLLVGQSDVVMACLPMTEVGITCGMLGAMFSGAALVLPAFDPALDPATVLETIASERITVLEGSPAMYLALLDAAHHDTGDFSSLRVCISAGGSASVDIMRRFEYRFGCVVVDADDLFAGEPHCRRNQSSTRDRVPPNNDGSSSGSDDAYRAKSPHRTHIGASMADGDLNTQFNKISDKAKAAADTLRAANERSKDQLERDVASAQERSSAAADRLKNKADDARDSASSQWQDVRTNWHEHVAKVRSQAKEAKAKANADSAAMDADFADAYAYDAIDFALGAIEEAEYAVLDAMYARATATAATLKV